MLKSFFKKSDLTFTTKDMQLYQKDTPIEPNHAADDFKV